MNGLQRLPLLAATLALVAAVLRAQTPAPPRQGTPQTPAPAPVFRARTEIVNLDVVVVDKAGNPVHDLTRDDFLVLDRRKPQAIDTFDEVGVKVDASPATPTLAALPVGTRLDVSSNADQQAGRLVVVVLDDLHTYRGRADTVKGIARDLVDRLGSGSSMALLQTGGQNGVEVTTDRSRLLASIDAFKGRRAERRPIAACDNAPIPMTENAAGDRVPSGTGCNQQDVGANMSLYKTLEDAARILGGRDSRRRVFVLVSENVAKDLSGLFGVNDPPGDIVDSGGYATGGTAALATVPDSRISQHDIALLNMMRAMQRGGVSTYSIDPRGEVKSSDMMRECSPSFALPDPCEGGFSGPQDWTSWIRVSQHGLEHISEASGGFAVVNTNDFAGGIARIARDLDNYYLIGFRPSDTTTKGFRPIEVRIRNRPGLTLRYRRGYEIEGDAALNPRADPLASLVNGAMPQDGLPMRLHALSMPYTAKEARVAVSLELSVPRQALEGADQVLLDQIRYGIFAIDVKGAKVRQQTGSGARVALRARAGADNTPDRVTYQIAAALSLPPGRYQLRASATSDKLASGGSAYLSIDVPDFGKGPIALTDLLLGYADGPHVPIARNEGRAGGPPADILPFEPTLDREFRAADTLRLYFRAVAPKAQPISATVSALTPDGRTLLTFDRSLPASAPVLDTRLPLSQLVPGAYRLHVKVTDGKNTADRDIGFVIK